MTTVLFNENKLVKFPANIIQDTNTFKVDSYCTLGISNNMMGNLQLNIKAIHELYLGHNEFTVIHFKNSDNLIGLLNISSNRLVTLPETLPKAKQRKGPSNDANSNRFDNNAYVPNEYEMSSGRRDAYDQQLDIYDKLSENNNNTGEGAYEHLNN
ncbi:unnamed protein product [Mytilus coruscus]|uniref:Uncharacterized protein n=1 Tax=Mytilus coruscus TaxID=42192 RepID=A0A6J8B108_MYTCO|nr:unnamed protein product [Mytilus coruscus]